MQPTHAALHFGDTGIAASPRSRNTFCAVKQPYSREQTLAARACGSADPSLAARQRRFELALPKCRGFQSSLSSVRIAATYSSSSTTHANV